jgi:dTDP-4-amino-4,6-dideoxygalactose transaminase
MTRHEQTPWTVGDGEPTGHVPIAAPRVGEAERARVDDVLASGHLAAGDEVAAFEDAFAEYCGVDRAVATANGTAALQAALTALGVGEGDLVVTTPFSFVATANAVRLAGAEPVFADVDPGTFNLDPDAVEAVLAELDDVAAILVVHLFGLPADVERFRELADAYGVALIEDAAQAHGAAVDGRRVGAFGDAAAFSFYPTKNMTTGEGGMVTTDDDAVADRVRSFVDHGRVADGGSYEHATVGHNLRMTEVAGALGREQLTRLPFFTERRRRNARRLTAALAEAPLEPQAAPEDRRHVYNQYTVRCPDREALRERLEAAGVETRVYYPTPIHEQPAYDGQDVSLPNAEAAAESVLSLPVHPSVGDDDVDRIARAVVEATGVTA